MAKLDYRRPSTVIRHNHVRQVYREICEELGRYSALVPRGYIYGRIQERTGLCLKTIAFIVNHLADMGGVSCEFLSRFREIVAAVQEGAIFVRPRKW